MTYNLVLLRHGESVWNEAGLFTGWYDADLTEKGQAQARQAGIELADAGVLPTVLHTSLQTRAIRTANLALDELDRLWIPVRRSWRLNERHYGGLQGKNKKETTDKYGLDQVKIWRRSYDVPPPKLAKSSKHHPANDARYAHLPPDVLPATECLKDVVERMLPYWYDGVIPDLAAGNTVLITAHGNSLRALVKHLDKISDAKIAGLDLPTGVPFLFELGDDFLPLEKKPVLDRVVGDPEAAKAAAAAVAKQAG